MKVQASYNFRPRRRSSFHCPALAAAYFAKITLAPKWHRALSFGWFKHSGACKRDEMESIMPAMLRVFLWIIGVLGSMIGALFVFLFLAFQPDIERETHDLKGGAQIQLDSSTEGDFHGDATTDFTLSLRHPNGFVEKIAHAQFSELSSGYATVPGAPFELRSNGTSLFLRCDALFYERPQSGGNWINRGDLKSDDTMLSVARLLMPRVYGKLEWGQVWLLVPKYVFERWDESKNVVVLLQSTTSGAEEQNQISKQEQYQTQILKKWPRRLVFRNFRFDQKSTLALQKREQKS